MLDAHNNLTDPFPICQGDTEAWPDHAASVTERQTSDSKGHVPARPTLPERWGRVVCSCVAGSSLPGPRMTGRYCPFIHSVHKD